MVRSGVPKRPTNKHRIIEDKQAHIHMHVLSYLGYRVNDLNDFCWKKKSAGFE